MATVEHNGKEFNLDIKVDNKHISTLTCSDLNYFQLYFKLQELVMMFGGLETSKVLRKVKRDLRGLDV